MAELEKYEAVNKCETLKEAIKNMYSEEEVLKILYNYNKASNFPLEKDDIVDWFKQFKK